MSFLDIITDFLFELDVNAKAKNKKPVPVVKIYQIDTEQNCIENIKTSELEEKIRKKIELSRVQRNSFGSEKSTFIQDLKSGVNCLENIIEQENFASENYAHDNLSKNQGSFILPETNTGFVLSI